MSITKQNNGWLLEVDLIGGRIVGLEKNGQKILGTFERIDGKKGNTHICCPNFGAEGVEKYGFTFHGPFRNKEWKLILENDNCVEINCEIEGLNITQKFCIEDIFEQEIIVNNVSNKSKPVNVAIHNYFNAESGWEETRLNGLGITQGIKDSINLIALVNNTIEIPQKDPINWQLNGFKNIKLWTGFVEANGEKTFDQKYICLEPVIEKEGFVETEESMLNPGKEIVLKQSIIV